MLKKKCMVKKLAQSAFQSFGVGGIMDIIFLYQLYSGDEKKRRPVIPARAAKPVIKTAATLSLALTLCLTSPSYAEKPPIPTLDRVKTQQTAYLETTHPVYDLETVADTVPDGAITVKIGNTSYYYTPAEPNSALKLLSSTGGIALEETTAENALYKTPDGKYWTYNPAKLKESAYKLTPAAGADSPNTITLYEKTEVTKYYDPQTGKEVAEDALQEGVNYREVKTVQAIPEYYTVSLKQTEYGKPSGDTVKYYEWTKNAEGKNEFKEVFAPTKDKTTITVKYDSSLLQNRIENTTSKEITGDFIGNYATTSSGGNAYGGAIYNSGTIEGITGDFIGNYTTSSNLYTYGGAIYNARTIGEITGDFIGNYTTSSGGNAYGGAIYNKGTIGKITGDFIGNYATSSGDSAYGGAIYNYYGTIEGITGDFIGNYATSSGGYADGGAIYNNRGTIEGITGDFIGNYATSSGSFAYGGAIYNKGTIGKITGDFIGNYVSSSGDHVYGGAIYNNRGTIEGITGDFIGNYATTSSYGNAYGGAIYKSYGTIEGITGDFIGNYATSSSGAYGGAIYNDYGTIEEITGDFIGNYATSSGSYAYGGAIYNNRGTIEGITGDFIGNYATSSDRDAYGGAIYNKGTIGEITGDFIGNYATSSGGYAYGGAIYNSRTIEGITGDFIGNYATSSGGAFGGAIYNYNGTIEGITGDFIGNYATTSSGGAFGGAIYNNGTIGEITGDFIGNYVSSSGGYASGGAIYNYNGTIEGITGDFIGNYATSSDHYAYGGAIYNSRTIEGITGDFIGNYVSSSNLYAYGGAIYNNSRTIEGITGDFIGNYATSSGGNAAGGAIYNNNGTIGEITGDFIGNYATSSDGAFGGAIFNTGKITGYDVPFDKLVDISNYIRKFTNQNTGETFTIYDLSDLNEINAALEQGHKLVGSPPAVSLVISPDQWERFEKALNAAIQSGEASTENPFKDEDFAKETGSFINLMFINNYTESKNGSAAGGAIFSTQNIKIVADNGESVFSGNKTISNSADEEKRTEEQNAIGMYGLYLTEEAAAQVGVSAGFIDITGNAVQEENPASLKLEAKNNGVIRIDDTIRGGALDYGQLQQDNFNLIETPETAFSLSVTGDSTGKVIINNDVVNANISLDTTNLYLGRENVFDRSQSLTLNSGAVYMQNNAAGSMHIPALNLNGAVGMAVDADLANKTMDRITADNYNIKDTGSINVNNIILLSDAKENNTDILFADEELKNNVSYTGASPVAYSPIYKYQVSYKPETGEFNFLRGEVPQPEPEPDPDVPVTPPVTPDGGGTIIPSNPSDMFNPAVLTPAVAAQAGAYTTQIQTFNYAFQHADTFMNIPYIERIAISKENQYALSPTGDVTDVGTFSPLMTKEPSSGFWVKPYASFENVPMKNGPKVSNINYGTLIGYDTKLEKINHGFERVITGYIGYNGASQRYSGVDAYQNGGLIGATTTFYKGNFFNATTLSVGASVGDATTMYGSENYTMLLSGIGNKTGYNFEFMDGKVILQPNFLISYTFVNTFDYTNAAGVKINSDPMHAIQLSPGVKLIANTKNGWQPYLGVNMVWNLLDKSEVYANDVRLPEMSIKPYVQYGVGLQKRFTDKFMAYGQAMIHNGGRNGISFSFGLRWKVGRDK